MLSLKDAQEEAQCEMRIKAVKVSVLQRNGNVFLEGCSQAVEQAAFYVRVSACVGRSSRSDVKLETCVVSESSENSFTSGAQETRVKSG